MEAISTLSDLPHMVITPTAELTPDDMKIIAEAVEKAQIDGYAIYSAIANDKAVVWRMTDDYGNVGFMIIEGQMHRGEQEILVLLVCGNVTKDSYRSLAWKPKISAVLEDYARERGIKRLRAFQGEVVFKLISEPLGWEIERYEIVKEL